MENLKNRVMLGKINKHWLYLNLLQLVAQCECTVIEQDENSGYNLGHQFGIVDTLRTVIDMVEHLPEDDPDKKPERPWRQWNLPQKPRSW